MFLQQIEHSIDYQLSGHGLDPRWLWSMHAALQPAAELLALCLQFHTGCAAAVLLAGKPYSCRCKLSVG
jgi:hypothetical protein